MRRGGGDVTKVKCEINLLFASCSSSDCDSSSLAGDSRSPGDQVVPISEGGPGLADAAWEGDTGETLCRECLQSD